MLSEEGAEARNKYYKRDRLMHAPAISEIGLKNRLRNRIESPLPIEVCHLLKEVESQADMKAH